MATYKMTIAGLERELPICKVNDNLDIAGFVIFGDVEMTVAAAGELLADVQAMYSYTDDMGVSSLTLRFSFISRERTLTKQELQPSVDAVAAALAEIGLTVKA